MESDFGSRFAVVVVIDVTKSIVTITCSHISGHHISVVRNFRCANKNKSQRYNLNRNDVIKRQHIQIKCNTTVLNHNEDNTNESLV